MTIPRRYLFEGQPRTIAEIRAMMPVYSEKAIRGYMAEQSPPTTRAEMHALATARREASYAAMRKNAERSKRYFAGERKP